MYIQKFAFWNVILCASHCVVYYYLYIVYVYYTHASICELKKDVHYIPTHRYYVHAKLPIKYQCNIGLIRPPTTRKQHG